VAKKSKAKSKIKTWAQVLPKEGVACIYGHRRKGKTATAWWLAEKLAKKRPVAALMFPKKAKRLLPKEVRHINSIADLKKLKGYLVVADEMAIHANAREHQSDSNKELYKLMAVSAQCHQLLLLICQHTWQLDVGLAMEPDIVVFKQPSLLHIRFARPELKPEVEEAWKAFATARGDKRSWSYVVNFHDGRKGFLRNRLPSFWSQELSEAYALYELNLETQPKKKPRRGKR